MRNKIEKDLGELLRMYGECKENNTYWVSVSSLEIYINGNFAEEYEDLEDAKCLVQTVLIDIDSDTPYFKMCTAFSTHFPLMSNDSYNISLIGSDNIAKICTYINKINGEKELSEKRKKELRRVKLKELTDKVLENFLGNDFHFVLDLCYCCMDKSKIEKEGYGLEELETAILLNIQKSEAFAIMLKYPTYKSLYDSGHLAFQDGERKSKWDIITMKVYDKCKKLINKEEFNLLFDSENILDENGRLIGDVKTNIKIEKIKKPKKSIQTFPKRYESLSDLTGAEWKKAHEKLNKKYETLEKKLGHPRFEIILSPKSLEYYILQLKSVYYRHSYLENKKCMLENNHEIHGQNISVYNCNAETSLPLAGAVVIDHFDTDKTPYLVGDIMQLWDSQRNYDEKNSCDKVFIAIHDNTKRYNIEFAFIKKYPNRENYEDRYWRHASMIKNNIDKNHERSKRTLESHKMESCLARISASSIRNYHKIFYSDFEKDDLNLYINDLKKFDFNMFEKYVMQTTFKNNGDKNRLHDFTEKLPSKYSYEAYTKMSKELNYGRSIWQNKLSIYDLNENQLTNLVRWYWNSIRRHLINDLYKHINIDAINYDFIKQNEAILPCDVSDIGFYYLTDRELLTEKQQLVSDRVKIIVDTLMFVKDCAKN